MDRGFLFGVFAAQLGLARPDRVIAAASAWLSDKSRSIPDRLLGDGAITDQQKQLLEGVVDEALKVHGDDVKKTVDTMGGDRALYASFGGSVVMNQDDGAVTIISAPDAVEQESEVGQVTAEHPGKYSLKGGSAQTAEIGRGGIGRVLVAFDEHLGREIAIKELLSGSIPPGASTPKTDRISRTGAIAARFLREARVTGQLEHPNIVPVYEVGERGDGAYYYTMKLVRGRTC